MSRARAGKCQSTQKKLDEDLCKKRNTEEADSVFRQFAETSKEVALFDSVLPVNFAARTEGFNASSCSGSPLRLVIPCFRTPLLPSRLPSLQLWTMHHRFRFDIDLKDLLPFRWCPSMLFSRLRPIVHSSPLLLSGSLYPRSISSHTTCQTNCL